jgi:hypothetical protein
MVKKDESFNKPLRLLPPYFLYVGIGFVIISGIVFLFGRGVFLFSKETTSVISGNLFLLALTLLAFTKDGIEDELTALIRVRAMSVAFLFGVSLVIIEPIFDLVFGDEPVYENGVYELLFTMYVMYFVTYLYWRRKR